MSFVKKFLTLMVTFSFLEVCLFPNKVLGALKQGKGGDVIFPNPLKTNTLPDLLDRIINYAIVLGFPVATLGVAYAGWLYMTSGGDENKVKTAKSLLTWIIVGFIILLSAKGIMLAIINFFK